MQLDPTGGAGYCLTSVRIKDSVRVKANLPLVLLCPAAAKICMRWAFMIIMIPVKIGQNRISPTVTA